MYCTNCGKEINDQAVVCPNCGVATSNNKSNDANGNAQNKNGMAVAGFVCSFFIPILGWVFGGIGLSRALKRNNKGKGFSIASIVIASVNFLLGLIIF